jgi:hypothetical protein
MAKSLYIDAAGTPQVIGGTYFFNKYYDPTEILTGDRWIDDQPIYRGYFTGVLDEYTNPFRATLATGVSKLIDYGGGLITPAGIYYPLLMLYYYGAISNGYLDIDGGNLNFTIVANTYVEWVYDLWVEYTKV